MNGVVAVGKEPVAGAPMLVIILPNILSIGAEVAGVPPNGGKPENSCEALWLALLIGFCNVPPKPSPAIFISVGFTAISVLKSLPIISISAGSIPISFILVSNISYGDFPSESASVIISFLRLGFIPTSVAVLYLGLKLDI